MYLDTTLGIAEAVDDFFMQRSDLAALGYFVEGTLDTAPRIIDIVDFNSTLKSTLHFGYRSHLRLKPLT